MSRRELREANDDHQADREHVDVRRYRKSTASLARAAQVERRQDDDEAHGDRHLVARQRGHGGRDVAGARGDGHGDGQDVVDQQGRGHKEPPGTAEILRHDLVVTATRGVCVDGLAVGGDHDGQHECHDNAHPDGLYGGHCASERQRQEDLVGCVGDRRQRVGGKNRKGDAFGKKLVAHRVRSHRASDEHALRVGQQVHHNM